MRSLGDLPLTQQLASSDSAKFRKARIANKHTQQNRNIQAQKELFEH